MSTLPHEATPDFLTELHLAIVEQSRSVDTLAAAVRELEGAARVPFRDSGISNQGRLVRAGAAKLTWLHAWNPGAADAFLHFFDEYSVDAVIIGALNGTKPALTLGLSAGGGVDDPVPPIEFVRGIVVAATSTIDGAAAPATAVLINLTTRKLR